MVLESEKKDFCEDEISNIQNPSDEVIVTELQKISDGRKKKDRIVAVFFWTGLSKDGATKIVYQRFDSMVSYSRNPLFLTALNEVRESLFPGLPFLSDRCEIPDDVEVLVVRINVKTGQVRPVEIKTPEQARNIIEMKRRSIEEKKAFFLSQKLKKKEEKVSQDDSSSESK